VKVERTGDGPRAFVGVHGWAGNVRTFRRLYDFMPADAAFYAMDLPGYGASERPSRLTLEPVLASIAEAIGQAPGDDITLVCNCGGAQFGLETLRVYGLKVRRVALIDPFGYCPWYFRLFTGGTFGRNAYYTTFANPLGRFLTNSALRKRRRPGTDLTAAFVHVDHETVYRYLCLMVSLADSARFRGLCADVDVLHGERTFRAVRRSLAIWREVFPQARIHALRGAGHEPIREATAQLAEILFGVAGHGASSGADGSAP